MKIFFIRHAEAIEYETSTVTLDEYRFITPNGRKVTKEIVKHLKEKFLGLEKIFTSPLTRAVQTAEIFADELNFEGEVELVDELKNEAATSTFQQLIKDTAELNDSIALVGHEPKMSFLLKLYTGLTELNFDFKKSGVCLVEFDIKSGAGTLKWYFNPETMEFVK